MKKGDQSLLGFIYHLNSQLEKKKGFALQVKCNFNFLNPFIFQTS